MTDGLNSPVASLAHSRVQRLGLVPSLLRSNIRKVCGRESLAASLTCRIFEMDVDAMLANGPVERIVDVLEVGQERYATIASLFNGLAEDADRRHLPAFETR